MNRLVLPKTQRRIITFVAAGTLAIGPMAAIGPAASASPDTGETPAVSTAASAKKKPAKSNLKYSLAAKSYTGKARSVSVKSRVSGMGKVTVYYQGTSSTQYTKSKAAPKKAGAYAVSVKIAASKKFRAATLKLGTMKIVSKWKITFDAHGGKIGSAKTKSIAVKNKAKLGKLPVAKRSGYSFQGW